ncbi:MAG TPA: ABC transporter substrate-binding protein [Chloroflexota bacterium]|nr:ABC transporter substrate-binding protein [Chloroflexota bacterium]
MIAFVGRLLVCLASFLTLVSCASPAAAPSQPPSAAASAHAAAKREIDHVQLLYPTLSGDDTFAPIAMEKGFFTKYGLTGDVQYAQSSSGIAAVLSGQAQFDLSDGVVTIQAVATGNPFKVVANFNTPNPYALIARSDTTRLEDLKGKTLMVGKLGDGTDVSARWALKSTGLKVGSDVSLRQGGNSPERWAAISSGQVDAAMLDAEAYVPQAETKGMHVLANLAELGMPWATGTLITTSTFLRANPNTVLATLRAIIDGMAYYADDANKADSMTMLAKDLKTSPTDPLVAAAYEGGHRRHLGNPLPVKSAYDGLIDILKTIDPAQYGSVTSDQVIEPSFVATLQAQGVTKAIEK